MWSAGAFLTIFYLCHSNCIFFFCFFFPIPSAFRIANIPSSTCGRCCGTNSRRSFKIQCQKTHASMSRKKNKSRSMRCEQFKKRWINLYESKSPSKTFSSCQQNQNWHQYLVPVQYFWRVANCIFLVCNQREHECCSLKCQRGCCSENSVSVEVEVETVSTLLKVKQV